MSLLAAIAAQPSDDDYFTQVLGQPVNMSNRDDIDIWFTEVLGGLSNVTVNNNGNGLLEATWWQVLLFTLITTHITISAVTIPAHHKATRPDQAGTARE